MIKANYSDKQLVVEILSRSFDTNKSVNYTVKQDAKRAERIRQLMSYSFEVCYLFGAIYLSNDKKACALTLLPDQKKTTLKAILLDAKLALSCIGLSRVKLVLDRQAIIKSGYPNNPVYYLWFIGVDPKYQKKGIGSTLLNDIIKDSNAIGRPLLLETSMPENVNFYKKFGFEVYRELQFNYDLFCMKKEIA